MSIEHLIQHELWPWHRRSMSSERILGHTKGPVMLHYKDPADYSETVRQYKFWTGQPPRLTQTITCKLTHISPNVSDIMRDLSNNNSPEE